MVLENKEINKYKMMSMIYVLVHILYLFIFNKTASTHKSLKAFRSDKVGSMDFMRNVAKGSLANN